MDLWQADAVESAVDGELRLLQPDVRSSPRLMGQLLDPDFMEIGVSGRLWDRATIIAAVTEGADSEDVILASEMDGVELAPGIVHLTYLSDHRGRLARRSSIWRHTVRGWQLYFHQGTMTAD